MIMAKIIKRTDALTEPPLTTALTGRASPQGEAAKRLTIFADFCDSKKKQGETYEIG